MKTTALSLLFLLTLANPTTIPAGVLPNDAIVDGKTISEWSGEFFKWLYSIPTNQHPVFDYDGSRATNHQPPGHVFFLTSVYGFSSVATRRFTIPEDTYLFFPVLTVDFENINTVPIKTIEELREAARQLIDTISELHASIDGVPVPDLLGHRAISPVFTLEFPTADNLKTYAYGNPIVGLIDPVVADGYWLMVEPLPPGEHVINFGGHFAGFETFRTDITDTITVVPVPLEQRVEELMAKVEAANLPSKRIRPLLAMLKVAGYSFAKGKVKSGVHHLRDFQHKVRAQVAKLDETTAAEWIEAAQSIIDRTRTPQPRAAVLPPHATLFDKTLAEYSAEWWIYNYSFPVELPDPAFPPAGPLSHPSVYFLEGLRPRPAGVNRTFTVPEGVYVFFPIVGGEGENINTIPPLTIEELRVLLEGIFSVASEIRASIDGVPVNLTDLAGRREISPVFSYFFESADNLKSFFYGQDIVGLVDPVVADGYYLMLEPLPVGLHELHVGYKFGPPLDLDVDTPFNINVVPRGVFLARDVDQLIERVNTSTLPANRKQPLLASLEAAVASLESNKSHSAVHQLRAFQHKVRAQVVKLDEATAAELIEAAQAIIDRVSQQQAKKP